MKISYSTGRFTSGQLDAYAIPDVSAGAPIVLYGHGAGGNGGEIVGANNLLAVPPIVQELVRQGFVVIAVTATALWGNSVSDGRLDDGLDYARDIFKASADPPAGLGASHGFPMLANYALDHTLSCLVGLIPAADLQAIRVADTLGQRAAIDAAHGVTYPAALPAGSNPMAEAAGLTDLVQENWYANDDAVSQNITVYNSVSGAIGHDVGALGHTNAAIAAADISDIVDFIKANI